MRALIASLLVFVLMAPTAWSAEGAPVATEFAPQALVLEAEPNTEAQPANTAPILDEVLVTGEQPGPGLWRITKPDAGHDHVLWVLGSHSPLPKKMTWRSKEVEVTIAESQELLLGTSVKSDIGFFRGAMLLPSLIGIRDNPDDAKLEEVVPPELYARWLVLKEKYIGRNRGIENWRPIFAAAELYQKAMDYSGLAGYGGVRSTVEKIAKKNKLKITIPEIHVEFDKPRAAIKEFKKSQVDDVECFAKTIERIETDLYRMRARANAWAIGNIEAMRQMPFVDQIGICIAAVMDHQIVKERGFEDVPERLASAWLAAAEAALAKNQSTFAILSVDEILKSDGYVATLRARGYVVEDP
jgi:hypothetical protein